MGKILPDSRTVIVDRVFAEFIQFKMINQHPDKVIAVFRGKVPDCRKLQSGDFGVFSLQTAVEHFKRLKNVIEKVVIIKINGIKKVPYLIRPDLSRVAVMTGEKGE